MKRITTVGAAIIAALVLTTGLVVASAKADFSGAWTLDKAKSEGLPPDVKSQTMTVKQTGDSVAVETKTANEGGEEVNAAVYTLDGKEAAHVQKGPNGMEGKGKRISTWAADGNGFDVKETAVFDTPGGVVEVKGTRKWVLAADGKTLTIDMTLETPMGTHTVKRLFTKN
ncbi:MAG TPA: hypothetical protein VF240_10990 [Pyrinomonadaceae bacterium]